jgi:hypothetical protein
MPASGQAVIRIPERSAEVPRCRQPTPGAFPDGYLVELLQRPLKA